LLREYLAANSVHALGCHIHILAANNIAAKRSQAVRFRVLQYSLLAAFLVLGAFAVHSENWRGNPELHTLLEMSSALLALTAGVMSLVRYYAKKSSAFLLLGSCFLGTGILDAYHGLITSSFLQGHTPSALSGLTPWSGAVPRIFLSLLLCVTLLDSRKARQRNGNALRESLVYTAVGLWAVASFVFFSFVTVKPAYYSNFVFHRPSQLVQAVLFALALTGYLWKGTWKTSRFEHYLVLALITATASDFAYMEFYKDLYDAQFTAGHILKIFVYLFVLVGLFSNTYSIFKRVAHDATILEASVAERTAELAHEIATRKAAQANLEEAIIIADAANRAKSDFLANMSHEIRTPLNGVIGMTDLALETELTPEQREYLNTVKLSGDSLLILINDILDFSKIEAGKLEIDEIDFDLRENVEETMKTLAHRADEKGLELLCEFAHDLPPMVRGDPSRLRQILLNVVGNAIKFTTKGEVSLTVAKKSSPSADDFLQFTVTDTGIGIPPEKQKLIFEPFSQADASTTRKFGGTGLGLTICTRLVAMMGGKIWVNSEVGQGTQFHFTIGVKPSIASVAKTEPAGSIRTLAGFNVLIVDDNVTNVRILESMLKRWGMKTSSADGAVKAIAELIQAKERGITFDLILTDMHMPEIDGFGFVEGIRKSSGLSAATIMMLTSGGHRGDALRCKELGVNAYLLKPVRQNELRLAIINALNIALEHKHTEVRSGPSMRLAYCPLQILIAEDNAVNQLLLTRVLEKRGHQVSVVGNGREALSAMVERDFDLVFMDVQMPIMDGLEATEALRETAKDKLKRQPVIALTAHAMKGDSEKCIAAGMDGYLTKPIRTPELDAILQTYMDRRMLQAPEVVCTVDPGSSGTV
jgi:signal transduction histidine kinase/CheY-like chemotaxis protein